MFSKIKVGQTAREYFGLEPDQVNIFLNSASFKPQKCIFNSLDITLCFKILLSLAFRYIWRWRKDSSGLVH